MKRFLFCLVGICLMSSVVMAQRFSNSLGAGGTTATTSRVKASKATASYNTKATVSKRGVVKTVLRYTPAQTTLNEEHESQIMPIVRRVQEGRTKSIEVVGISRDYTTLSARLNVLRKMFLGYMPSVHPKFRHITGGSVFNSNDNTVEIYEYY